MKLSKKAILERIDQRDIMERYFPGSVDLRKRYRNPFRNDKNKGCYFNYTVSGTLVFFDNASGVGGNCFDICMLQCQCSFYESLKTINQDFNLGLKSSGFIQEDGPPLKKEIVKKVKRKRTEFNILTKQWSPTDTKYWEKFGITEQITELFNVHALKHVAIHSSDDFKFRPYHDWTPNDPMYGYRFDTPTRTSAKVYRPLAKAQNKWRSNAGTSKYELQGYAQLPETGDLLVITSSLKDVMVLYSYDIVAIAPHSEHAKIRSDIAEELKRRFKRIVVFFDSDEAGILASEKMQEEGFDYVLIPPEFKEKDISDFREVHGNEKTEALLNALI